MKWNDDCYEDSGQNKYLDSSNELSSGKHQEIFAKAALENAHKFKSSVTTIAMEQVGVHFRVYRIYTDEKLESQSTRVTKINAFTTPRMA